MDQEKSITPQQEIAILELIAGKTQKEAAASAGVAPETVCRWMKRDAVFIAELNARRQDLWRAQRDALRGLVAQAVQVMGDLLKSKDERVRLQAASAILRTAREIAPKGQTDPEMIEHEQRQAEAWRKITDLTTW